MPKPSAQRLDAGLRSLREHRGQPNVSLHKHVELQRAALWKVVRQHQRVYLDTRFWILLRDVALGRPRQDADVTLLNVLRELVQSGAVVCPLGDGTLLEVLRQSDPNTRLATERLMDELSLGVAIQNAEDRLKTEVFHLITTAPTAGATALTPRWRVCG